MFIFQHDEGLCSTVDTYYCAERHGYGCKKQLKLVTTTSELIIYRLGIHERADHSVYVGKRLSKEQKKFVQSAVKCNPSTLPSTVRRGSHNLDDAAMHIMPKHRRAVANLVAICRQEFHEKKLGVATTKWGPKAVLRHIATTADAYDVLRLHSGGRHPVKLDDVICLGHQISDGVVFVSLSTFSLSLNMFSTLNSAHPVVYQGDSTFKIAKEELCITTANTNELGNKNHIVALAITTVECSMGYGALYSYLVRILHAVKDLDCRNPECELCEEMRGIRSRPQFKAWSSGIVPQALLSFPISFTMSDNTGKFFKFARDLIPSALRNGCRGHFLGANKKGNKLVKYFVDCDGTTAQGWYDIWYDLLLKLSDNPYLHLADGLQDMTMKWLHLHGQEVAAGWFGENWSLPDNGRWMICHFEHAGPFNNNGVEGNNGGIKTFVLNQSGHKTTQTATALVSNTMAYLQHKSMEGRQDLVKQGQSFMFKNLPSIRNADIEKLKKMHPRAAQLITCIQLETEWQEQMDQFMAIGNDDLSLYERLAVYQRNHREVPRLDTDKFLKKSVDFYFPSEHFLCRIDKKRTLSLQALRSTVKTHLKRHLTFADAKLWDRECENKEASKTIVVNELERAAEAIHDFRLVQVWPRLTAEANDETLMMKCFCPVGHKFCFCHHSWVLQLLVNRRKSFPIPYETVHVAEVEDIPLRKAFRTPDDPKPSQIPRNWHPVSLLPRDWNPTEYAVDPEYDDEEARWFMNEKLSKQAMDDQREDDIFEDHCAEMEANRVMCI